MKLQDSQVSTRLFSRAPAHPTDTSENTLHGNAGKRGNLKVRNEANPLNQHPPRVVARTRQIAAPLKRAAFSAKC